MRYGGLALVCVLALSACGTPGGTVAGSRIDTTPPASPGAAGTPSARASGAVRTPPTATTTTTRPASPTASAATNTTAPKVAPLAATLARTCVTPGTTQTLTVTTAPASIVVYDNLYSDGNDGQAYGGIEKNGRADKDGRYTGSWVVAPNAPPGRTRLDLAVAGKPGTNTRQIYYDVKSGC